MMLQASACENRASSFASRSGSIATAGPLPSVHQPPSAAVAFAEQSPDSQPRLGDVPRPTAGSAPARPARHTRGATTRELPRSDRAPPASPSSARQFTRSSGLLRRNSHARRTAPPVACSPARCPVSLNRVVFSANLVVRVSVSANLVAPLRALSSCRMSTRYNGCRRRPLRDCVTGRFEDVAAVLAAG